nr:hypothetical protein [uncultured Sphingomonas sp.]
MRTDDRRTFAKCNASVVAVTACKRLLAVGKRSHSAVDGLRRHFRSLSIAGGLRLHDALAS